MEDEQKKELEEQKEGDKSPLEEATSAIAKLLDKGEDSKHIQEYIDHLVEQDKICKADSRALTYVLNQVEESKKVGEQRCYRCGHILSPEDKFCPNCGASRNHKIQKATPQIVVAKGDAVTATSLLGILSIIFSVTILFGFAFGLLGKKRAHYLADEELCMVGIILTVIFTFACLIALIVIILKH